MLLRTVVIAASFFFASPIVVAQAPTPAAATKQPTLGDLFTAANADPAAIPALIIGASTTMSTLPPDKARLLGDSLEPYLERAFFSPERFAGMERLGLIVHKVEKGENPTTIARRCKIGAKMLEFLNEGFDEKKMRVGVELKVLDLSQGAVSVNVSKSLYRVSLWRELPSGGRSLVMYAPAGLGAADSPTPIGKTTITKRVLDPQWTDPETKQTFAPGDPGNVLGGYWMALDAEGLGRNGIGFHGYTGAPAQDWIAKPASHGCVRMLQHDIDHLFHLALEGTVVTIEQ